MSAAASSTRHAVSAPAIPRRRASGTVATPTISVTSPTGCEVTFAMKPRQSTVTSGDVTLFYRRFGSPDTLVLIERG